jgi:hypothetical protein
VETVEKINSTFMRPSLPAAAWQVACPSVSGAPALAAGVPAVAIEVRTAPIFGLGVASGNTSKINFIGKAESLMAAAVASAPRDHQVNYQLKAVEGVKVTDARGIPPRGWPV